VTIRGRGENSGAGRILGGQGPEKGSGKEEPTVIPIVLNERGRVERSGTLIPRGDWEFDDKTNLGIGRSG